jgi:5-methylcytosine-specific restriction protein B
MATRGDAEDADVNWSIVQDRTPALRAIAEFDALGRDGFLHKYGFGRSTHLFVRHEGRRYDIKAIAGVMHGYAEAAAGPLSNDAFSSGKPLVELFRRLGFDVENTTEPSMLDHASKLREALQEILAGYRDAKVTAFGKSSPIWEAMGRAQAALSALVSEYPHLVVKASVGAGNWATVPWIALLDERLTDSTQHGVYLVYLFRGDMTGVYATYNQGVTKLKKDLGWSAAKKRLLEVAQRQRARSGERLRPAFTSAEGINLRAKGVGTEYEASTIAWRLYETGALPPAQELMDDLYRLLDVYDAFAENPEGSALPDAPAVDDAAWSTTALARALRTKNFMFETWQVAAFVHALRTKPFVILAGISGTGKSKLPLLVGELTGTRVHLLPVRPDWTDSADLVGYTNLQGTFVPGRLLEIARSASEEPTVHHIVVLDEMNLARVEQYFAEVLSLIEDREWTGTGARSRVSLIPSAPAPWGTVRLPGNLSIVGTVNMDETTHGFSRKVLDRAFTLEMSDVDLSSWRISAQTSPPEAVRWSLARWQPVALRPADIASPSDLEYDRVEQVIATLNEVNEVLSIAQLQVGYRVRDEVALFVIHASADPDGFAGVDPLDLALTMKVLPRIQGGSSAVRAVLQRLLVWAHDGKVKADLERTEKLVGNWTAAGRSVTFVGARFPRTAARLCLMWERLQSDGFTSYWL